MTETNEPRHLPIDAELPDTEEVFEEETVWVLMKMRSKSGATVWRWRSPGITNHEELLGALVVQVEMLKRQLLNDWE